MNVGIIEGRIRDALSRDSMIALVAARRLSQRLGEGLISSNDLLNGVRKTDEKLDSMLTDHGCPAPEDSFYRDGLDVESIQVGNASSDAMFHLCNDPRNNTVAVMQIAESLSLQETDQVQTHEIEPLHILLALLEWDESNGHQIFDPHSINPQIYSGLRRVLNDGVQISLNRARETSPLETAVLAEV